MPAAMIVHSRKWRTHRSRRRQPGRTARSVHALCQSEQNQKASADMKVIKSAPLFFVLAGATLVNYVRAYLDKSL